MDSQDKFDLARRCKNKHRPIKNIQEAYKHIRKCQQCLLHDLGPKSMLTENISYQSKQHKVQSRTEKNQPQNINLEDVMHKISQDVVGECLNQKNLSVKEVFEHRFSCPTCYTQLQKIYADIWNQFV